MEASGSIGGILVYGNRQITPNRIGAVCGMTGSTSLNLSGFQQDTDWWTSLVVVNPNASAANVTMRAYRPGGALIDTKVESIGRLCKSAAFVKDKFTLGTDTEGWVEVTSDVPVVGMEMLNADDAAEEAWGLAAIEAQPAGLSVYFPHQVISSKWWTLFGLANPDDSLTATVDLKAYNDDGTLAKSATHTIPANGNLMDWVKDLLGF